MSQVISTTQKRKRQHVNIRFFVIIISWFFDFSRCAISQIFKKTVYIYNTETERTQPNFLAFAGCDIEYGDT